MNSRLIISAFLLLQISIIFSQTAQSSKQSAAREIESAILNSGIPAAKIIFNKIKADTLNYQFKETEFNSAGYRLIDMGLFNEALEIFLINVGLFPRSANVYDSLGEVYLYLGDRRNAIESYGKIESVEPSNNSGKAIIANIDDELSKRKMGIPGKFFSAAKKGNLDAVKSWLSRDKSLLNKVSVDGDGALHLAAYGGHLKVVEFLISNGARLNERNLLGQTPYNLAVKGKSDSIKQLLAVNGADTSQQKFPELTGDYLGQKLPGMKPEIFARGIVSTHSGVYANIAFSKDFKYASWTPNDGYINQHSRGLILTKNIDGLWTKPEEISFMPMNYGHRSPFFSLDGRRLLFQAYDKSNENQMEQKEHFYYVEETKNGWSEPKLLDTVFNLYATHWQFSLDKNNNLYFSGNKIDTENSGGIYFSKYENGRYAVPELLPASINSGGICIGPAVSPDGEYIIFIRFITSKNANPKFALYLSFRNKSGGWHEAIDLGSEIGIEGANNPRITHDGKYIFFVSGFGESAGSYWVDAKVIEKFMPRNK